MAMKDVRDTIRRAAKLLAAAGAGRQATAVMDFDKLLEEAGDASASEFVTKSRQALDQPLLGQLSVGELVQRLRDLRGDRSGFERFLAQLKSDKAIDKAKSCEIAAAYVGAMMASWKSKAKALEAIKERYDSESFLIAKERMNVKVTPW